MRVSVKGAKGKGRFSILPRDVYLPSGMRWRLLTERDDDIAALNDADAVSISLVLKFVP